MTSIFLDACHRKSTSHIPVWLMRQAGRYMKEYREVRDRHSFLELCKNKDLVTEVTVYAQERLKADAAIIFSDILLIVEAFGLPLDYKKGDGPSIGTPLRNEADVKKLKDFTPEESLGVVLEAITQTKKALQKDIALIGFAGAPFTVASYMIEGGGTRDFVLTKKFMRENPQGWALLLTAIADKTAQYLKAQVRAGADAVQIFDSWVGHLTPEEYERYVYPYSKRLIDCLSSPQSLGGDPRQKHSGMTPQIPVIHFGTRTAPFLEKFAEAGGDVIGVDQEIRLDKAWTRIGPGKAIQGNLDPKILLTDLKTIERETKKILDQAAGRPGYIFNLGHGVLPETPVEHAIAVVEMVHSYR